MSEIRSRIQNVLDRLSGRLTKNDVKQINELVSVGELEVAFEDFCTQIYERDAVCSVDEIQEIASIGKILEINESYWSILASE